MKPYVITISRQFASMGRTIAQYMSKELGIEFMDRDIVAQTARRMGLTLDAVSNHEESSTDGFFIRRHYLFNFNAYDLSDEIFEVQKNIIIDFAEKGPCIIVGRCADWILKDRKNVLSVYIYAPFRARLHNCTHNLMMEEKIAMGAIKHVDEVRKTYRLRYCPDVNTDYDFRHLMIDSSRFGIEGTAALLCDAARHSLKM